MRSPGAAVTGPQGSVQPWQAAMQTARKQGTRGTQMLKGLRLKDVNMLACLQERQGSSRIAQDHAQDAILSTTGLPRIEEDSSPVTDWSTTRVPDVAPRYPRLIVR